MNERRKVARWRINKPAKLRVEGALSFIDCLIRDINLKGVQVVVPLRLKVDTYIKFKLKFSDTFSIETEGWIAWHRNSGAHNIYGILFTKLTDTDKENIYKFVYQSVPETVSRNWWKDALKEGGDDMNDRRIFQRFSIRFPIRLLDLNSGREVAGETSDISAKGIGVCLKDEIPCDTSLEAWLNIPDKGEPLYTRGSVVWSRPDAQGDYRLGIDLERADLMGLSRILRV
ncbi:MAG: PilZ domain-containing protein [Candidatus Omnitrophota bacterium]|nr:PilZ domain-containing protein [Euryarchaeota archaeon]